MPKDSQLLTPASRALLRAARAGCIYIRHVDKDIEDEEKEATDLEEAVAVHRAERSFTARKWAPVPRHLEPPEFEFLAKRRSGLPSLYGASAAKSADGVADNGPGPMRRTRFQKVDPATGNISIYEAWVPEGHKIEGEITEDVQTISANSDVTVKPEAPAPGTVVEGVGVVDSEGVVVAEAGSAAVVTPKRRPPPPKRKGRGGFKGRRKRVMFAAGDGADAAVTHDTGGAGHGPTDHIKQEDSSRMQVDQSGQDEEEEDGEDGEDSDGDESMPDAKTPEPTVTQPTSEPASHQPIDASAHIKTEVDKQPPGPDLASVPSEPQTVPQTASVPGGVSQGVTNPPASDIHVSPPVNPNNENPDTDMTDAIPEVSQPPPVSESTAVEPIKAEETTPAPAPAPAPAPTVPESTVPEPPSEPQTATEKVEPPSDKLEETIPAQPPAAIEGTESQPVEPSDRVQETSNDTPTNKKQEEVTQVPDQGETSPTNPVTESTEQTPPSYQEPTQDAATSGDANLESKNSPEGQVTGTEEPAPIPQADGAELSKPIPSPAAEPAAPPASEPAAIKEEQNRPEQGQSDETKISNTEPSAAQNPGHETKSVPPVEEKKEQEQNSEEKQEEPPSST